MALAKANSWHKVVQYQWIRTNSSQWENKKLKKWISPKSFHQMKKEMEVPLFIWALSDKYMHVCVSKNLK